MNDEKRNNRDAEKRGNNQKETPYKIPSHLRCRFVFLIRLRDPPGCQVISRTKRNPLDVLKSLTDCCRIFLIEQKCDGLLDLNEFLPLPVELFSLFVLELASCLLEQAIRFRILKICKVHPVVSGARVIDRIWIRDKIESESQSARIEPVLLHRVGHEGGLDNAFGHLD